MVKASVGVMVLVVLFTLSTCKCGGAFETGPAQQQGIVGGGIMGEGETQTVGGAPAIGGQTSAPHPDKTKEKQAVSTGNSGTMSIIPNSGYGQYPTPVLVPGQEH
jgi:hypothetical protein